jgi:hypothetical protein
VKKKLFLFSTFLLVFCMLAMPVFAAAGAPAGKSAATVMAASVPAVQPVQPVVVAPDISGIETSIRSLIVFVWIAIAMLAYLIYLASTRNLSFSVLESAEAPKKPKRVPKKPAPAEAKSVPKKPALAEAKDPPKKPGRKAKAAPAAGK